MPSIETKEGLPTASSTGAGLASLELLRARTNVTQFINLARNPRAVVGFEQLSSVASALTLLQKQNAAPDLLSNYHSALIPEAAREGVRLAGKLADGIARISSGTANVRVSELQETADALVTTLRVNFDARTLPRESQLLSRYREARTTDSVSEERFGQILLRTKDSLRRAELITQLAETGTGVAERDFGEPTLGTLELLVARRAVLAKSGLGSEAQAIDQRVVDNFGKGAVRNIVEYARHEDGERGASEAGETLANLSEQLDSPLLRDRVAALVRDVGFLAERHNQALVEGRKEGAIEGLGRVLRGCLALIEKHAREARAERASDDHELLGALNGFCCEAFFARKFIEASHSVKALDKKLPVSNGDKEVDLIVDLQGANGKQTRLLVEVKSGGAAIAHSIEKWGANQFIRLAEACAQHGGSPALAIAKVESISERNWDQIRFLVDEVKRVKGVRLFVIGPDLKSVAVPAQKA